MIILAKKLTGSPRAVGASSILRREPGENSTRRSSCRDAHDGARYAACISAIILASFVPKPKGSGPSSGVLVVGRRTAFFARTTFDCSRVVNDDNVALNCNDLCSQVVRQTLFSNYLEI